MPASDRLRGGEPLNDATKYVASRSRPSLDWGPAIRHGLVDKYHPWVFPLMLGSGKRLFADGTIPAALRLVDSNVSTTGVVMGTYEPARAIVTGSFSLRGVIASPWPRTMREP